MIITQCGSMDEAGWLSLRRCLWPHVSDQSHRAEMLSLIGSREAAVFIARIDGQADAFAEAKLRHDYVVGCASSPVGFLEGIYVAPARRKSGIARLLVDAVADWARNLGCRELASDTPIDNAASQAMHRAIGFTETERVVFFSRPV